MNDLISVIVPVYNAAKYLERCIESLLVQTYAKLDIILVDDGSKDDSGKICDRYEKIDPRIRTIHISNGGASNARNRGIEESLGSWLTFLDADDYVAADHIESLLVGFESDDINLGVTDFIYISESGEIITQNIKKGYCAGFMTGREALEDMGKGFAIWGYIWNKLYCKDTILENNIRFRPDIKIWEDMLFNAEYLSCTSDLYVNEKVTYYYIKHENSVMTSKSYESKKSKYTAMLYFENLLDRLLSEKIVNKNSSFYNWVKTVMGETCLNDVRDQLKNGIYNKKEINEKLDKVAEYRGYLSIKNKVKYYIFKLCPGFAYRVLRK